MITLVYVVINIYHFYIVKISNVIFTINIKKSIFQKLINIYNSLKYSYISFTEFFPSPLTFDKSSLLAILIASIDLKCSSNSLILDGPNPLTMTSTQYTVMPS